jgi:hypothetical protein
MSSPADQSYATISMQQLLRKNADVDYEVPLHRNGQSISDTDGKWTTR